MSHRSSHTHSQVAQADIQAKTCRQRVPVMCAYILE